MNYLVKTLVLFCIPIFFSVVNAQTPDGETPANEGVCDDLIGLTPGLYGLCVAFCEAQDCEAIFDPATGVVTFDESCKPSSPKLLANYNKRMQLGDPTMPCVRDQCPCWSEAELDNMADGRTIVCRTATDPDVAVIYGNDGSTWYTDYLYVMKYGDSMACHYVENYPKKIDRFLRMNPEEVLSCLMSVADECASRGF